MPSVLQPTDKPDSTLPQIGKLEPEFTQVYSNWMSRPEPANTGKLVKMLKPAIDKGVRTYVGQTPTPYIQGKAKQLAIAAIKSYDPERAELKTHVTNYLKGLQRANRQSQSVIKVPDRVFLDLAALHRYEEELQDQLGREPTDDELSDYSGVSRKRLLKIRNYRNPMAESQSVDLMGDAGAGVVNNKSPELRVLPFVYSSVSDRDKLIIEWSLGLNGKKPRSNQQIAEKLGVTPGAISQRKAALQAKIDEAIKMELI